MVRRGGEKRGSSYQRRARKVWMLSAFGDGTTCKCVHCGVSLTFATVEADRKVPGGSYRRENVQPACRRCNAQRSNNPNWRKPKVQLSQGGIL
jgi:5-methylcytosine-specific restriction endonuclease McrA